MKRLPIIALWLVLTTLSASGQATAYRQFANLQGVQVSCKTNYRLGDVKVDITLLRVPDSVAFVDLCRMFNFPLDERPHSGLGFTLMLRDSGNSLLQAPLRDGRVDIKRACLLGASSRENTLFIIENIRTEKRYKSIVFTILQLANDYQYNN